MATMLDQVILDGVTVTTKKLKWQCTETWGYAIKSLEIEFTKNLDSLKIPSIGQSITVKRGFITATDEFVFQGIVVKIEETGYSYKLTCYDMLYDAVKKEVTYSYDKNIDTSAGVGSEIFKDLINNWTDLTADNTSVIATGTLDSEKLTKFICRHEDVFDKCRELCEIYKRQMYYNPNTALVYFIPKGYTLYGTTLQVGTNILNRPKWSTNNEDLCNYITVLGATQDVETTSTGQLGVTTGWTAGAGGYGTLAYKPVSVKVYADAANPPTTLRKGGVPFATGTYDYEVDFENKKLVWSSSNGYAWTANHYVKVEVTYRVPVPVTAYNQASIDAYGKFQKTVTPRQLMTVNEAEQEARRILDKYAIPGKGTEIQVSMISDLNAGDKVRVIDTYNSVDAEFIAFKIVKKYPHTADIIEIGDRELGSGDIETSIIQKIQELEQQLTGDSDFLVNIVDIAHSLNLSRNLMDAFKRDIAGVPWLILDSTASTLDDAYALDGGLPYETAYYNFEEGTGTSLLDNSFNEYHATITGATYQTGKVGSYCLRFSNGTTDYVSIPYAAFNNIGDFSMSFWVKLNTLQTGGSSPQNTVFSQAITGQSNNLFVAYDATNNRWLCAIAGTTYNLSTNSAVEDLAWHHIAITRSGSTITLYVDGTSIGTTAGASTVITSEANGVILGQEQDSVGGGFASNQCLAGDLDEFHFWNYVITSTDVSEQYNSGTGRAGWYPGRWNRQFRQTY